MLARMAEEFGLLLEQHLLLAGNSMLSCCSTGVCKLCEVCVSLGFHLMVLVFVSTVTRWFKPQSAKVLLHLVKCCARGQCSLAPCSWLSSMLALLLLSSG